MRAAACFQLGVLGQEDLTKSGDFFILFSVQATQRREKPQTHPGGPGCLAVLAFEGAVGLLQSESKWTPPILGRGGGGSMSRQMQFQTLWMMCGSDLFTFRTWYIRAVIKCRVCEGDSPLVHAYSLSHSLWGTSDQR